MPDDAVFAPFVLARRADGTPVELGRGGMGITYRATDTQLGRTVALKVINAIHLGLPAARQRFLREARAAAQLHHANVAGVFQLRAEGADVFYAMEFVEGETVEAYVQRRGSLPWRLALRIVLQAAQGLAAADERGLIHRDIKPANLMLARPPADREAEEDDGLLVKVIDFGLAKSLTENGDASGELTGGNAIGTPPFMSPEQISPEAGIMPDCRSDIYSLGITLWYLLVGRAPFEGSQFQVFSQHMQRPPPMAKLTAAGVPPEIVALVGTMLAKDREDRPASHGALIAALKKLLRAPGATTSTPAAAPPVGIPPAADATTVMPRPPSVAVAERRKPRIRTWWIAAAALALVAAAGGWLLRRAPEAPVAGPRAESEAARLARGARETVGRLSYTREELALAEESARRATELEPISAAAWSARAVVNATYLVRLWDRGEKRRQDTEDFANRALALNPNEADAFYALARLRIAQGAPKPAEELLRRAVVLRPDEGRLRRSLATTLVIQGRPAEARAELEEAIRRNPRDALAHYDLALGLVNAVPVDVDGALQKLDAALAVAPFTSARLLKIRVLGAKGDVAGMRAELDQLPAADRGEERAVYVAMTVALLERRLDRVLEAAALTAKTYFEDLQVAGPKGWLTALAYTDAGKENLARLEWQAAEIILRQRLKERPDSLPDQARLAVTLAWLGRKEDAALAMSPVEAAATENADRAVARHVAYYYAALGDAAKAVPWIRRGAESMFPTSAGQVPIHPFWLKLRGQPEFEALLAELRPAAEPDLDAAAPAPEKSVAVLPFSLISADKNDEYLSDGMTEELLNVLGRVKGLRVPGRTASFAFKGRADEGLLRKVGLELKVDAVLEGSVRKAGDKLRTTARLTNVADGALLWSETYDGDMKDLLAVQGDVARRVVRALQVRLGIEEERVLAKKPTENPEAYRSYLLGRYHFARVSRAGWTNAIRAFEEALKKDPNFALAYCGLADTYGWCGGYIMPGREAWPKQKALALRALALDPTLAEVQLSLGAALFSTREYAGSEAALRRALELDPKLALAHDQFGWTLLGQGRPDEAVEQARKALALDSLDPLLNTNLGLFLQMARRYDEAIVQLRKALELDDNNAYAHNQLARCLHWKGRIAEALAEAQRAAALGDLAQYAGGLGFAYAASGDRTKAEQALRDLEEAAKTRYVTPAACAGVYLEFGQKDLALDWLEKALEAEDPFLWWCKSDQTFDSVRDDPRFQAIVRKADARP